MIKNVIVFCGIAAAGAAAPAFAASVATDVASDSEYDAPSFWESGDNGGTGFGAWSFASNTSNQGVFIGDSTSNGTGGSGGINTAGESFGLYSNTAGSSASASRTFGGNTLMPGQTFSILFDHGNTSFGNSEFGFSLTDGSAAGFVFKRENGESGYEVFDGNGERVVLNGYTTDGLTIDVTLKSGNTYDVTATFLSDPNATVTLTDQPLATGNGLTGFTLFSNEAGDGDAFNVFFNDINVSPVPEPLGVLAGGSLIGLLTLRRR